MFSLCCNLLVAVHLALYAESFSEEAHLIFHLIQKSVSQIAVFCSKRSEVEMPAGKGIVFPSQVLTQDMLLPLSDGKYYLK